MAFQIRLRTKVASLCLPILLAACGPSTPAEREAEQCVDGNMMAAVMVQDAVKTRLKAPSTADFPLATARVSHLGECKFLVMGPVDAQNGFGAMLRNTYMATIQYDPKDETWQVLEAEVLN